MKTIFSTNGIRATERFQRWREICEDRLVPMSQTRLGEAPFDAVIEGTSVGSMVFTKFQLANLRATTTSRTIRHPNNRTDQLFLSMVLEGSVCADQMGRSSTETVGDLSLRDTNVPWTIEHKGPSDVLALQLPRDRLENMLGSTRLFAGLTIKGSQPTAALVRAFLGDLARLQDQLTPDTAERMTSIGIDLIVASVAERMAQEAPKSIQGTLIVQRAKAYVEANLGDPSLDPTQLAAAMGVSLRRLQQLFHDRGRHISDWIWQRRLDAAARRLADPALLHLQVGAVSFGCGFTSQAHFSRRFKERHQISPGDYRRMSMINKAGHSG